MRGIVFTEFLEMVEERFTLEIADHMITAAACTLLGYGDRDPIGQPMTAIFAPLDAASSRQESDEQRTILVIDDDPAAITLDMKIPDMDGWTILTALKADPALASMPVMVLTIIDDKPTAYALGASDYLTKPPDLDRLTTILKQYTRLAPPDPKSRGAHSRRPALQGQTRLNERTFA